MLRKKSASDDVYKLVSIHRFLKYRKTMKKKINVYNK